MITVFAQYYIPKNTLRRKEIDACFKKNLENPLISKLIIYFENDADRRFFPDSPKLEKRSLPDRMTYGFWLKETDKLPLGTLSLLINSDIYLTESISHLLAHRQALAQQKRFIAITRYNPDQSNFTLNKDPHWCQDTWGVVKTSTPFPTALLQEAAFELGQPGCDNKIAYVMHSYGYSVTNPCYSVKTVHLQADDGRSYDPKISKLIGLHAFVHPSESVLDDSALEFDLLTRNLQDLGAIRVNNWINSRESYQLLADKDVERSSSQSRQQLPSGRPLTQRALASDAAIADASEVDKDIHPLLEQNTDQFVLKDEFASERYRLIADFSERFKVYADTRNLYFYDRYWPVVRKVEHAQFQAAELSSNSFVLFATGFIPACLDLGLVSIAQEMQYRDDVLFWQFPAKTEADAYEVHQSMARQNIDEVKKQVHLYIGLPWATFIDKTRFPSAIIRLYASRVSALKEFTHQVGYELKVHTVCQHINWQKILPFADQIGITELWIAHKTKGFDIAKVENAAGQITNKIPLHAWPLYAVNYRDFRRRAGLVNKPIKDKTIFASFIGAYMGHYLSDVRLGLLKLEAHTDYAIEIKNLWHFNELVYEKQVLGKAKNQESDAVKHAEAVRYNSILSDSVFSLCPVGAGYNSLRLWESLAVGSIPVILADGLDLPALEQHAPHLNLKWSDAVIFHAESDLETLDTRLRAYSPEELESMRAACLSIYKAMEQVTCFGKLALERQLANQTISNGDSQQVEIESNAIVIVDRFKDQQIHVVGATKSNFNGINDIKEVKFLVGVDGLTAIIHFDQVERLSSLVFNVILPDSDSNGIVGKQKQQLELSVYRYNQFNKFQALQSKQLLSHSQTLRLHLDPAKTIMAMGLKIELRLIAESASNAINNQAAHVHFHYEAFEHYFAKRVQQFDAQGLLKILSDSNPERQDDLFDTKRIESGEVLQDILRVAAPLIEKPGAKVEQLFPEVEERTQNLLDEPLQDGITMYVHLMNRNENVQANLPNWLKQEFDELILLDWSSKESVANIPGVFNDPRVRVVRVEGQEKFMRTLAQNLASQMARYRHIFKCDSDVSIKGNFLKEHPLKKGEFWVGDWHQGRDFNERHLHGETYYHVDDYFRVNGYDERILAYGHDDTNLKDRMVLAGLIKKVFNYNHFYHHPHDQALRTSNQVMVHPMVKTYENRIRSNTSTIWTSNDRLLEYVQKNDAAQGNKTSKDKLVTLIAKEKYEPHYDQRIEDKAINIVSSWYEKPKRLEAMSKEQKIQLIWEKQVE
jgi:hypothetical protein